MLDQGGPVGDADDGAGGCLQLRIQPLLVFNIKSTRGFVEHRIVRFGQKHPSHG